MKTYKAAMTVFGLGRGDTFESDDPGWEKYATPEIGLLVIVEEAEDGVVQGEPEQGAGLSGGEDLGEEGEPDPDEGKG